MPINLLPKDLQHNGADGPAFDAMDIIEADLDWTLEDDGVEWADGVSLSYEIDEDDELGIFTKSGKCWAIRKCVSLAHAEFIAEAWERLCISELRRAGNDN